MLKRHEKVELGITLATKYYHVKWQDMFRERYKLSHARNYAALSLAVGLLWDDFGYRGIMEVFKLKQTTAYDVYDYFKMKRDSTLWYVEVIHAYKMDGQPNYYHY